MEPLKDILSKVASPLKKSDFLKPLASFGKAPDLLGITLTDSHVKLAHAKMAGGKVAFQSVSSKPILPDNEDQISDFVSDYLVAAKSYNPMVICAIPAKFFISKNVEIPSVNREEIAKIIDLQAGRFTPYSRDEIVIDFLCMDTATQHYTSVLLIIINRKVVERYLRILEKAHIPASRIMVTSEAASKIYPAMVEAGAAPEGAIAGMHVGEDFSDLIISDKGQMIFVRNVSIGAEAFRSSETAQADFLSELNKSLSGYQDQGVGSPIRHMVITGITEVLPAVRDMVQKSSPILEASHATIKIAPYRDYFDLNEKIATELEAERRVSFFELLASLAAFNSVKIDLTPSEVKLKKRFQESSKEMMQLGVLIMTLFLIISLFMASKIYIKGVLYDKLDGIHKTISGEARSLERISTKNRVVRQLLESRGKGLKVFEIVSGIIGEDIYLSSFSYQDDGKIGLAGTAQSMSKVFAFVTKLEESNYFTSVKTKQTKSRREGSEDVADFEIEAVLSGGI